ncbi:MAG: GAF domain-containing sensor histidine kinase [Anaerolineales bacterium]|jgi:signal transduction histidine kinase
MIKRPNNPASSEEIPLLCELAGDSAHLIQARWAAGALVLLATVYCVRMMSLPLPEGSLYLLGGFILLYNAALVLYTSRDNPPDATQCLTRTYRIILVQIALDWFSMAVFLHLTGGICSPAKPLLLIHVLVIAILMSRRITMLFVLLDVGTLTVIALLEHVELLPHHCVTPAFPSGMYSDPVYVGSRLAFIALAAFAIGYLTTTMMNRQRIRDHRIAHLLLTTQTVSSTLKLPDLLGDLVRCATEALSVRGASIRMIDESSGRLVFSAAHGLSQAYLTNGPELSIETFESDVLTEPPLIIHDVSKDTRLRHSPVMIQEGLRSMVSAPILSRGRPLGILNVYAEDVSAFQAAHADFIMKIAYLGATAIENAMSYERLEHAGKERGMFVRMVTHELRTPVAGAQSLVKTLLRGLVGEFSDQQTELLHRVDMRLGQLMELINDLLALAAGRMEGSEKQNHAVPLLSSIRQSLQRLSQEAETKHVEITFNAPEGELFIRATEDGLSKVFGNLMGNAIKYVQAGGRIGVEVKQQGDLVQIAFSDDGMGIPEDDLPHIWDEFFRGHNARSSGIAGTGLGLSIVKHFVERFGGLIQVESKEGEGSTFSLLLPICDQATISETKSATFPHKTAANGC